jgi:hypothetical protein
MKETVLAELKILILSLSKDEDQRVRFIKSLILRQAQDEGF